MEPHNDRRKAVTMTPCSERERVIFARVDAVFNMTRGEQVEAILALASALPSEEREAFWRDFCLQVGPEDRREALLHSSRLAPEQRRRLSEIIDD